MRSTPSRAALSSFSPMDVGSNPAAAFCSPGSGLLIAEPTIAAADVTAAAEADDIHLGDVVVSSKVYAFHGGKAEGSEFLPRPQVWQAPHLLDQLAGYVHRTGSWVKRLNDTTHGMP